MCSGKWSPTKYTLDDSLVVTRIREEEVKVKGKGVDLYSASSRTRL